jgi:hypothetical protein
MLKLLCEPLVEGIGPVKAEHSATAGIRLQEISKASLHPGALVLEWQRSARCGETVRHAFAVLSGLKLDTRECVALFLGLDNSDWRSVDKEKVVSLAMP